MKISKVTVLLLGVALAGCSLPGVKSLGSSNNEEMNESTAAQQAEGESMAPSSSPEAMMEETSSAMPEASPEAMMEGDKVAVNTVKVAMTAQNFSFSKKEIRAKKGDTVKVTVTNNEGTHDWNLDEFGVKSGIVPAGSSKTVEFVADKTGTFEYYCSVGNHRQMGMVGNLVVE